MVTIVMMASTGAMGIIIVVCIWVVVKIRVPVWALNIIRHLIFRVPKKGP